MDNQSRLRYALGHGAIDALGASSVLVIGLDGAGAEVAKNLILSGCGALTLVDDTVASLADLATHAYLSASDIGAARARACRDALAALSPPCVVSVRDGPSSALDAAALGAFDVVVVAGGAPLAEQLRVNEACRASTTPFVVADACGLGARVFSDFGDTFEVADRSGEPPVKGAIASISNAAAGEVLVGDGAFHRLADGDSVAFEGVEGMVEVNGSAARAVRVTGPFGFEIDEDTTAYGAFVDGGRGHFVEVKRPCTVRHVALGAALAPRTGDAGVALQVVSGGAERATLLHCAFDALHAFCAAHGGAAPAPSAPADIAEFVALARAAPRDGAGAALDEAVLRSFARSARGGVAPLAAFAGGVAAHEAIKAITKIGIPLGQFVYADSLACVGVENDSAKEFEPRGDRYDAQTMAIGRTACDKLRAMKLLVVGAGACGGEALKALTLMGIGHIIVADGAAVKAANVAGQCLYRAEDIGAPKASCAARAAARMNGDIAIVAHDMSLSSESEGAPFDDALWASVDAVIAAVDTREARLYLDQRCMYFQKPMFECGKDGTKGSTQAVLPFISQPFGATRDAPEPSYMICTLQNFPSKIEHTTQWSVDRFAAHFEGDVAALARYVGSTDEAFFKSVEAGQLLETLSRVETLIAKAPRDWGECVEWAAYAFHDLFHCRIEQLLHNFPADQLTSDGGRFWSGKKRCPTPLHFDAADDAHLTFVLAVAQLRCLNFGLAPLSGGAAAQRVAARGALTGIVLPVFTPKEGVKIAANDAEAAEIAKKAAEEAAQSWDTDTMAKKAAAKLPSRDELRARFGDAGARLAPIVFDVDGAPCCAKFVAACANLRARNYSIPEASVAEVRRVAGKIIGGVVTAAATAGALSCTEILKLGAHGVKGESDGLYRGLELQMFASNFFNLALPVFTSAAPLACESVVHAAHDNEWTWSTWDRIELTGPMTLEELIEHFEEVYGVEVEMVSAGVCILYTFYQPRKKVAARMPMELSALLGEVQGVPVGGGSLYLTFEVCGTDAETEEDVEVPQCRYKLP